MKRYNMTSCACLSGDLVRYTRPPQTLKDLAYILPGLRKACERREHSTYPGTCLTAYGIRCKRRVVLDICAKASNTCGRVAEDAANDRVTRQAHSPPSPRPHASGESSVCAPSHLSVASGRLLASSVIVKAPVRIASSARQHVEPAEPGLRDLSNLCVFHYVKISACNPPDYCTSNYAFQQQLIVSRGRKPGSA